MDPDPAVDPGPPGQHPRHRGFVLGLVGLVVGWLPIVGLAVTIPALLLSRAGRAQFRAGHAGSAGRSGAGLVLGWIGTAICVLMTVFVILAPKTPAPAVVIQPAAAPVAPAPVAPVLLPVPNVVGMSDAQAREVLTAAGFTNVVPGPSTGSIAGVAARTVTTQLPGAAAQASAGDPITLGEADAPPMPAAAPASAAAPVVAAEPVADAPHADTPRPLVAAPRAAAPAAPAPAAAPAASAPAASSSSSTYYANCTAAKAAGAAPLYRGEPGYRSALDRDNDGVACES